MSTDDGSDVTRRRFLRTAAASGAVAGATGTAAAAEGGEGGEGGALEPDFDGYLAGVDGGYEDLRGNDEVTVTVGADGNQGPNAFSPAGIWIDVGTTVLFEWTGNGSHNVIAEEGPADLNSGGPTGDSGVQYEFTFEESHAGITKYFCEPHESLGMKGGIAVGEDVPTIDTSGGGTILPDSAKALGVGGAAAMAGTLGLAYLVIKYGGTGRPADE